MVKAGINSYELAQFSCRFGCATTRNNRTTALCLVIILFLYCVLSVMTKSQQPVIAYVDTGFVYYISDR